MRYPALIQCLYSLLMLLPQSRSFSVLYQRLHSVPSLALMQLEQQRNGGGHAAPADASAATPCGDGSYLEVDLDSQLETFKEVLENHVLRDTLQRREKMPAIEFMVAGFPTAGLPRGVAPDKPPVGVGEVSLQASKRLSVRLAEPAGPPAAGGVAGVVGGGSGPGSAGSEGPRRNSL